MGRSYCNYELRFAHDMSNVNWQALYDITDVDHATNYLTKVLLSVIDQHAPVKRININQTNRNGSMEISCVLLMSVSIVATYLTEGPLNTMRRGNAMPAAESNS